MFSKLGFLQFLTLAVSCLKILPAEANLELFISKFPNEKIWVSGPDGLVDKITPHLEKHRVIFMTDSTLKIAASHVETQMKIGSDSASLARMLNVNYKLALSHSSKKIKLKLVDLKSAQLISSLLISKNDLDNDLDIDKKDKPEPSLPKNSGLKKGSLVLFYQGSPANEKIIVGRISQIYGEGAAIDYIRIDGKQDTGSQITDLRKLFPATRNYKGYKENSKVAKCFSTCCFEGKVVNVFEQGKLEIEWDEETCKIGRSEIERNKFDYFSHDEVVLRPSK